MRSAQKVAAVNNPSRLISVLSFIYPNRFYKPNVINRLANSQLILKNRKFGKKRYLIIWHDVLNNIITNHCSKENQNYSANRLIAVSSKYSHRTRATVFRQIQGTSENFKRLKTLRARSRFWKNQKSPTPSKVWSDFKMQGSLSLISFEFRLREGGLCAA